MQRASPRSHMCTYSRTQTHTRALTRTHTLGNAAHTYSRQRCTHTHTLMRTREETIAEKEMRKPFVSALVQGSDTLLKKKKLTFF